MSHMAQPVAHQRRWEALETIDTILEKPLIVLSLVWLGLFIAEAIMGDHPILGWLTYGIWALFIIDFLLGFTLAPQKGEYLRSNWLTAFSILLPAFRILRVFRVFRVLRLAGAGRSIGFLRFLTSVRRSFNALSTTLGRRGFSYIFATTVLLTFAGAAGLLYFESPEALRQAGYPDNPGFRNFGDALWWTAMLMTTIASEYWPRTPEGRLLGWLLSVYAFGISGYVTATIASHFIQTDKARDQATASATPATEE